MIAIWLILVIRSIAFHPDSSSPGHYLHSNVVPILTERCFSALFYLRHRPVCFCLSDSSRGEELSRSNMSHFSCFELLTQLISFATYMLNIYPWCTLLTFCRRSYLSYSVQINLQHWDVIAVSFLSCSEFLLSFRLGPSPHSHLTCINPILPFIP